MSTIQISSGSKLDRTSAPIALVALLAVSMAAVVTAAPAVAQEKMSSAETKPNILFIMGDDIRWMQPSIYHRGLIVGETPNIDRIGNEGAIFRPTTPSRAAPLGAMLFFTGMNLVAHGHDTAQLPGSPRYCCLARRPSHGFCAISATTPASSARTILATTPMLCRPRTASSSRLICITSTRWRG